MNFKLRNYFRVKMTKFLILMSNYQYFLFGLFEEEAMARERVEKAILHVDPLKLAPPVLIRTPTTI